MGNFEVIERVREKGEEKESLRLYLTPLIESLIRLAQSLPKGDSTGVLSRRAEMPKVVYIDLKIKPKGFKPRLEDLKSLDELLQRIAALICQVQRNRQWQYESDAEGRYVVRLLEPRTQVGTTGLAEKMAKGFIEHCGFEITSKEEIVE